MALFVHAQSVLAGQFDDSIPVNIERMLFPFYASETTGERDVRQETERRNQILAMYQAGLINESALLNEFDIAGTNAPPMSERQDVRQSGRAQALAMYNNGLITGEELRSVFGFAGAPPVQQVQPVRDPTPLHPGGSAPTPGTPGPGASQAEIDAAIAAHAGEPNVHHTPPGEHQGQGLPVITNLDAIGSSDLSLIHI